MSVHSNILYLTDILDQAESKSWSYRFKKSIADDLGSWVYASGGKDFSLPDGLVSKYLDENGYYVEGLSNAKNLVINYLNVMKENKKKVNLLNGIDSSQPDLSNLRKLYISDKERERVRRKIDSAFIKTNRCEWKHGLNKIEVSKNKIDDLLDRIFSETDISNFADSLIVSFLCCDDFELIREWCYVIFWSLDGINKLNLYNVISGLKIVGEMFKLGGFDLSMNWEALTEMNVWTGFFVKADDEQVIKDVKDWVDEREHKERDDDWYKMWGEGINEWFDLNSKNGAKISETDFMSLYDWIDDRSRWATTGASTVDVIKEKSWNLRNKFGSSLLYTTDELYAMCLDKLVPNKCYISQKPEKGKARIIVKSDLLTYILESYIIGLIMQVYMPTTTSISESKVNMIDRYLNLSSSGVWCIPTDIDSFDHQIDKTMSLIYYDVLYERVKRIIPVYYLSMFNKIVDVHRYKHDNTIVMYKDKKFVWNNGLMSGLAGTAFSGTAMSYSFYYMCMKVSGISSNSIKYIYTQGDDAAFATYDLFTAYKYLKASEILHIALNKRKFFISRKRQEFLRIIFSINGSQSYRNRLLPNILWRSPEKPFDGEGVVNEIDEIGSGFREAKKRGMSVWNIKNLIVNYAVRRSGLSRGLVDYLFDKPVFEGGMELNNHKGNIFNNNYDGLIFFI